MTSLPIRAAQIARAAHDGQKRKYEESDQDYAVHTERVPFRAMEIGMSETAVAAAHLHDVLEDCGDWRDEIVEKCGVDVLILVLELTNPSKGMNVSRAIRKGQNNSQRRHNDGSR